MMNIPLLLIFTLQAYAQYVIVQSGAAVATANTASKETNAIAQHTPHKTKPNGHITTNNTNTTRTNDDIETVLAIQKSSADAQARVNQAKEAMSEIRKRINTPIAVAPTTNANTTMTANNPNTGSETTNAKLTVHDQASRVAQTTMNDAAPASNANATTTLSTTRRISLSEALARVKHAQADFYEISKRIPKIRKAQKKKREAEAKFDKMKVELFARYANKMEALDKRNHAPFEPSGSRIIVLNKGFVQHDIKFGDTTSVDHRNVLLEERDEELYKLVEESIREISSLDTRDYYIARNLLNRERALLRAVKRGASDVIIKKYDDDVAYFKQLWVRPEISIDERITDEYRRCRNKSFGENWAQDITRRKEVGAAIKTIKRLVKKECPPIVTDSDISDSRL